MQERPHAETFKPSGKHTLDQQKKVSLPLQIIMWFFISISLCIVLSKLPPVRYFLRIVFEKLVVWDNARAAKRKNRQSSIILMKKKLFSTMGETINNIGGPVLEIGAGSAPNLDFYPENTKLMTIDLNERFKSFMEENLKKHDHVKLERYIIGNVEDMKGLVDDNSCSVVVSSLILCCVDQSKALAEIMRVLKPGGKLYFIEHLVEKPGTFTRWMQAQIEPIWKVLKFNCHLTRNTNVMIENAGFVNLNAEVIYRNTGSIFNFFFSRSYVGHCMKPEE